MLNVEHISSFILSWLVAFPILAALVVILIPNTNDFRLHKHVTLAAVVLEFIFSLHLVRYFSPATADFQFSEIRSWLPSSTGINYILGVDGLSLILVILTTGLTLFAVLTSYSTINTR